jgi:hypothetical protein
MKHPKRFLIHSKRFLPIRWNGVDPILDTHSFLGMLKPFEDSIRTWVAGARDGDAPPLVLLDGQVKLESLSWAKPVNPGNIPRSLSFLIPKEPRIDSPSMKRPLIASLAGLVSLLMLAVWFHPMPPSTPDTKAPIPERYARILMAPANRPLMTSRNQTTRSFSSKTVQNSIRSLLKTPLPKTSPILMNPSLPPRIDSLSRLAGGAPVGLQTGSTRIGALAGYTKESGPLIEGQGSGSAGKGLIGLNTLEAKIDEGLTREEVARVIHSHMNEIRFCYEAGILRDPTLAGKLLVDFKINREGRVPSARVSEASLKDDIVTQCLIGKLRAWKFPEPRGGTQVAVSYPFLFKSLTR